MNRLIIEGVAALALLGAFWWWSAHERHIGIQQERAKYEQALNAEKERVAHAERNAREISETKDREYQSQSAGLRNRIDALLADSHRQPIRLCKPASRSAEAIIPATAAEPHAAADAGQHDLQAGDDLGPKLVQYAGEAEGYRQQLIALQAWVNAQRAAW